MRKIIPELEQFGQNLKKIRKLKGITQKELAEKIGTSQRMISHYESKVKSPPLKHIILLADALQVSVDTLLGNKPIKYEFDARIAKKIKLIQNLPARDREAIWSFVNALIIKRKIKKTRNIKQSISSTN